MSQLILIQPTMERVDLSHQKSSEMAHSTTIFARHGKFLERYEKDVNRGCRNQKYKSPIKPVLDPNRFSTWNKLLLTLATVFSLIYRAKTNPSKKSQYTKEVVCLSQNFLLNWLKTMLSLQQSTHKKN